MTVLILHKEEGLKSFEHVDRILEEGEDDTIHILSERHGRLDVYPKRDIFLIQITP